MVKFIGICANTEKTKLYIVSELMSKGCSVSRKIYSTYEAIQIATVVSKALYYLHQHKLIHGDLKISNSLMDEFRVVKLCDVGVAPENFQSHEMAGKTGTAYSYMATKVFCESSSTCKADIFRFAFVLWQLLAGKPPYDEKHLVASETARGISERGMRPDMPDYVPNVLSELITKCWDIGEAIRPEFSHILSVLEGLAAAMAPKKSLVEKVASTLRKIMKIYRGTYCLQTVAIKEFNRSAYDRDEFLQEVQILRKVRHKNIVQFIGVCANPKNNKLYIISDFLSNGDLSSYMQKKWFFQQRSIFSTLEAVQIVIGVSKALCYMHKHNLIYRDLKPANLGMDEFKLVKICDFGVARVIDLDPSRSMTQKTGTYAYMAPEVYLAMRYSHKADVFSFGIVLWELLTGKTPYANRYLIGRSAAFEVAEFGIRPKQPKDLSPVLSKLIAQCWDQDDAQRPEFGDIVLALEEFAIDLVEITTSNIIEARKQSKKSHQKAVASNIRK